MNKKNILPTLLLPLLLLAGCTKEDYRNCPAGLYVTFAPENPKHDYAALVQRMDLYFYGQDGNLAAKHHYDRQDLRAYDRAAYVPQLLSGTYRVVAVMNCGIDTETFDTEKYSTLRSRLKSETVSHRPVAFFSGEKTITVGLPGTEIPTETIDIYKHTNDVRLKIVYDGYVAPAGKTLEAFIRGKNGMFRYDIGRSPGEKLATYYPWETKSDTPGSLPVEFDMTTMFIWHTTSETACDLNVYLQETSASRATGRSVVLNLTEELKKVRDAEGYFLYDTDAKLRYHDEYEITVTLGKDFVVLEITIDNWNTIGGGIEV